MSPNITKLTVSDHQRIVGNLRATIIILNFCQELETYLATEVTMLVILGIHILYGISVLDQCTLFYNTL